MKLHPGDVVEIKKESGLAYVQVTHNHPSYPEIVRLLPGLHEARVKDIAALAKSESHEVAMFPLGGAIEKKRVAADKVGSEAIPKQHKTFPTFRMPIRDKQGGVAYWWLWDGDGLRYETELSEQESNLPMREVMSVDSFLEKLG